MEQRRKDEFSLVMRVPSNKLFLNNVFTTLQGICEHCYINRIKQERVQNIIEATLVAAIELKPDTLDSLFDLKFYVTENKLQIIIENTILSTEDNSLQEQYASRFEEGFESIKAMVDEFKVNISKLHTPTISLAFNL